MLGQKEMGRGVSPWRYSHAASSEVRGTVLKRHSRAAPTPSSYTCTQTQMHTHAHTKIQSKGLHTHSHAHMYGSAGQSPHGPVLGAKDKRKDGGVGGFDQRCCPSHGADADKDGRQTLE